MASLVVGLVFFFLAATALVVADERSRYIIYLGGIEDESLHPDAISDSHHDILATVLGSHEAAKESMFYSYRHGFSGFAAHLTKEQADILSEHSSVSSVFPDRLIETHTTRSWDFLSMRNINDRSNSMFGINGPSLDMLGKHGRDVIIGVVDSGIWPESPSFRDHGLNPIPKHWKGSCVEGPDWNSSSLCNRKLIGAQIFFKGAEASHASHPATFPYAGPFTSARDYDGHGTHTASTAAGRYVADASLMGLANGTASGGASKARIASYKVLWGGMGFESDIVAGFDAAIHDGVDVLSCSIGSDDEGFSFASSAFYMAAFHAVEKGIVVVASAGNAGPYPGSVTNSPSWMFTVAASTIDRGFFNRVALGDRTTIESVSLSPNGTGFFHQLVTARDVANATYEEEYQFLDPAYCDPGSLDPSLARNKIVVCKTEDINRILYISQTILDVGAAGVIIYSDENSSYVNHQLPLLPSLLPYPQPTAILTYPNALKLLSYMNSTSYPIAHLSPAETKLVNGAFPRVADFSSRGPGQVNPNIIKPDITAPGVNILAAYPPTLPYIEPLEKSLRGGDFNILSGTSMSCPHVSGIVALLKSYHPDWSPAAIRSAIMTTASHKGISGTAFDFGAGHVNPNAAAHPGLVYDILPQEYARIYCDIHYKNKLISYGGFKCPKYGKAVLPSYNVNYPSIAVSSLRDVKTIRRNVTNVGDHRSVYRVSVEAPPGIKVSVVPMELNFTRRGQTKSYEVSFEAADMSSPYFHFGSLTWKDGRHVVTSQIAVRATDIDPDTLL